MPCGIVYAVNDYTPRPNSHTVKNAYTVHCGILGSTIGLSDCQTSNVRAVAITISTLQSAASIVVYRIIPGIESSAFKLTVIIINSYK